MKVAANTSQITLVSCIFIAGCHCNLIYHFRTQYHSKIFEILQKRLSTSLIQINDSYDLKIATITLGLMNRLVYQSLCEVNCFFSPPRCKFSITKIIYLLVRFPGKFTETNITLKENGTPQPYTTQSKASESISFSGFLRSRQKFLSQKHSMPQIGSYVYF